jgi:hypothetical protein
VQIAQRPLPLVQIAQKAFFFVQFAQKKFLQKFLQNLLTKAR